MTTDHYSSEARILRERQGALNAAFDCAQASRPPFATSRRLLQIYNGGSMPSRPNQVYLGHPVDLNGTETEGGSATPVVDTSTTVPVVVLWHAPSVGDILTAYAVGGRWVAERGGGGSTGGILCGTCQIPAQNLTVSWTNPILGNGSTTLVYSGSGPTATWVSNCSNQLVYSLQCTGGQVEFRATYFVSGPCPTGTSQYCSNLRASPFRLAQTGLTCGDNFLLTMTCGAACPTLQTNGFESFTVSNS